MLARLAGASRGRVELTNDLTVAWCVCECACVRARAYQMEQHVNAWVSSLLPRHRGKVRTMPILICVSLIGKLTSLAIVMSALPQVLLLVQRPRGRAQGALASSGPGTHTHTHNGHTHT